MHKIWEKDRLYSLLRPYVDACTRHSYNKVRVVGKLPEEGAVIIAPNHTRTLMDALVILRTRKAPTVFGARADIFSKPAVARILHFLRILPLARLRDGSQSVLHNLETFAVVDDVLENGVPFCLFPEGRHRPMHSLLPIGKGIARMAFASAAKRQTYVVPTGIEHGSFFQYRYPCTVTYGDPIDVNAFLKAHEDSTEAETFRAFRKELGQRIIPLITYIPDDGNYEAAWQAVKPVRKPQNAAAILTAPLFLLAAFLCLPMWVTAETLCKRAKDHAWNNTIRYGVKLLLTPLMLLFWLLVMPGWWKLLTGVLFLFSYSFFYDWINLTPSRGPEEE